MKPFHHLSTLNLRLITVRKFMISISYNGCCNSSTLAISNRLQVKVSNSSMMNMIMLFCPISYQQRTFHLLFGLFLSTEHQPTFCSIYYTFFLLYLANIHFCFLIFYEISYFGQFFDSCLHDFVF